MCAHQELTSLFTLVTKLAALSAPHSFTWHWRLQASRSDLIRKHCISSNKGVVLCLPFSTLKLVQEGWSPRHVLGAGSQHAAPQPVLLVPLETGLVALLNPLKSYYCLPVLLQQVCLKYCKSFCRNITEFEDQGLSYTILAEGWPAFSLALSWDLLLP